MVKSGVRRHQIAIDRLTVVALNNSDGGTLTRSLDALSLCSKIEESNWSIPAL